MIRQGNPLTGNNPHSERKVRHHGKFTFHAMQPTHTLLEIGVCFRGKIPSGAEIPRLIHIVCRIFLSLFERLTEDETLSVLLSRQVSVILHIQGHMRVRCAH